ncbi:hypothetical protein CEP54_002459 [Fusarium duplospermum]|uniref:HNH nuclease domain-containing protein n=1 Tax=Fusarium duplospermum TaxID=1325734 RepID=A0A428QVG7_9HYPO|nr:hypothetical protein CEP54_002459 [Fusarium duplospermum]
MRFQDPTPLLPFREAEIRREFAIQIEAAIRAHPMYPDFRLNAGHVATILHVPISALEQGGYLSLQDSVGEPNSVDALVARLTGTLDLVHHYLKPSPEDNKAADNGRTELSLTPRTPHTPRKRQKQSPASHTPSKRSYQPSNLSSPRPRKGTRKGSKKSDDPDADYQPKSKGRNQAQAKNCRTRDKSACVLMGTSDPQVCHIVPFSWNNNYENLRKTSAVFIHAEAFLGKGWLRQFDPLIRNVQNLASSDKTWNMICLNIQMQTWWGEARFGLKCLDIRPTAEGESVVTFQFNWMPCSAMKPTDKMNLQGKDSDFDRMVNSAESFWKGGSIPTSAEFGKTAALFVNVKSGVPLISGHLIEIEMPSSDAPLFKAMIDFQWAMIVVAALCGAAVDDENSFDRYFRTMEWVLQSPP